MGAAARAGGERACGARTTVPRDIGCCDGRRDATRTRGGDFRAEQRRSISRAPAGNGRAARRGRHAREGRAHPRRGGRGDRGRGGGGRGRRVGRSRRGRARSVRKAGLRSVASERSRCETLRAPCFQSTKLTGVTVADMAELRDAPPPKKSSPGRGHPCVPDRRLRPQTVLDVLGLIRIGLGVAREKALLRANVAAGGRCRGAALAARRARGGLLRRRATPRPPPCPLPRPPSSTRPRRRRPDSRYSSENGNGPENLGAAWNCSDFLEPPWGLEPQTYGLRSPGQPERFRRRSGAPRGDRGEIARGAACVR